MGGSRSRKGLAVRLLVGVGGLVLLTAALGCPAVAWAGPFTLTSFDVPNGAPFNAVSTIGYGVNDAGMIVGQYVDNSNATHGFLRDRTGPVLKIDDPAWLSATS